MTFNLKHALKPKSPLEQKIFDWNSFQLKPLDKSQLAALETNVISITRPEESPRVFIYGCELDFKIAVQEIQNWNLAKKTLLSSTVNGENKIIQAGAVRETFFYDGDKPFLPSNYFRIFRANMNIIRRVETMGRSVCPTYTRFDQGCYISKPPSAIDPMTLDSPNSSDPNQIYLGDKLMYLYNDSSGRLQTQLLDLKI